MDSSFLQAALFTGVGAFCVGIVLTLIGFALHATAAASGGHRFSPRVGGSLAEGLTQLVEHALLALADRLALKPMKPPFLAASAAAWALARPATR